MGLGFHESSSYTTTTTAIQPAVKHPDFMSSGVPNSAPVSDDAIPRLDSAHGLVGNTGVLSGNRSLGVSCLASERSAIQRNSTTTTDERFDMQVEEIAEQ